MNKKKQTDKFIDMRRKANKTMCRESRKIILEKGECWGTGKTMLYSIIARPTINNYERIPLGLFETKQERDEYFYEWKAVFKEYKETGFIKKI